MLLGYPRGKAALIANMKKIELIPMTRQMCHEFYKDFQNDPAIGHYYEYVYSPEIADRYFDKNSVPDRKLFAILVDGVIVGECKLKDIDYDKCECSMGIHAYVDISAILPDYVRTYGIAKTNEILRSFGADRLIFATDYPDSRILEPDEIYGSYFDILNQMDFTIEEAEKIACGNINQLLNR